MYFIGIFCSCVVTGYVLFEIMRNLYEKVYNNSKCAYVVAYIIYILLSIVVALLKTPILNVVNSMAVLYCLTKWLYKSHGRSKLLDAGFIIIYLVIVDIIVTVIFSTLLGNSTYDVLTNPKCFLVSGIGNSIIILCTYKLVIQLLQRCQISIMSRILHMYMLFLMAFEFGIICYFVRQEIASENSIPLLCVCVGFVVLDMGVIYLY